MEDENEAQEPSTGYGRHSRSMILLTVSFYLIAALVMVFVNKWVLNSNPIPIFFLFCQLTIAVILLKLSNSIGWIKLPNDLWINLLIIFNSHNSHHSNLLTSISPLILINTLGLILNTYCLKLVDASFYQVARGLILPFTVLASYIFLGTKSSNPINLSILIVSLGFIFGVGSEPWSVSSSGVLLGVLSSLTTSLHAIVVKRSIDKIPSTITLTYYTNALSAIVIFPFIFILGETKPVLQLLSSDHQHFSTFLFGTLITGFFGFLICIAGLLSIKVTSPITHMISSAVRGVIQTALGAIVFGDVITTGRMAGITLILIGSMFYSWTKDRELSEASRKQQADGDDEDGDRRGGATEMKAYGNYDRVNQDDDPDSYLLKIAGDDDDDPHPHP